MSKPMGYIGGARRDAPVSSDDSVVIGAHGQTNVRISTASTYMALDTSMSLSTLDCDQANVNPELGASDALPQEGEFNSTRRCAAWDVCY
jgi:hypothetical protein